MQNDYGVEINQAIANAKANVEKLQEQLFRAEQVLEDLRAERDDARKECGCCNDCSMCLG